MGNLQKYVIISGLNLNDNNRGTAALGYGAISFMRERGYLIEGHSLFNFRTFRNPFKIKNWKCQNSIINIENVKWNHICLPVFFLEYKFLLKFGWAFPITKFGRYLSRTTLVAAINGGDGFSDIYNTNTFLGRLSDTRIAMRKNIPLIILPQTIGPFEIKNNEIIAEKVLRYALKIYVRDNKYVHILDQLGLKYEKSKDLSYYMKPERWEIEIETGAIGINVSGLAYSNNFRNLSGQFYYYPELINQLISHFRDKGRKVYLIPHSYQYGNPEPDNDDMLACHYAYNKLKDKTNVVFVDKNLTSPQVKYLISKMSFFIGTRMHANFAAIYSGVPVFGLSYSYKFKGAFDANGLNGDKQTAKINYLKKEEISHVINKIEKFYKSL